MNRSRRPIHSIVCPALLALSVAGSTASAQTPLKVCATLPDLGDLAKQVGGDEVTITVFTKGPQDPHFVEAKPSFVKALHDADVYIQSGLQLEVGWAPVLLRGARNPKVQIGSPGFIDASGAIKPLEVPTGPIDRSQGDVHPLGNPHFLMDPLRGLRVAALIRDRFARLRPEQKEHFARRFDSFRTRLAVALLGDKLVEKYKGDDLHKLLLLVEAGTLRRFVLFLESQDQAALLGGWLGAMRSHAGTHVVADHNIWPYFAQRFGMSVTGFLEPKPGIAPTTRHLSALVERMRKEDVKVILSSCYFSQRHARFVSRHTSARVIPMAHQVGSREGVDSYLKMIEYNVEQLSRALVASP